MKCGNEQNDLGIFMLISIYLIKTLTSLPSTDRNL